VIHRATMRSASKVLLIAMASAAAGVAPAMIGCMGEGTTCPPIVLTSDAASDAHAGDGGDGGASVAAIAGLRLANFSPNAPLVDFCVAPRGTTAFRGPLLAALAGALADAGTPVDASVPGLGFPQVSAYVITKPGAYDARLVVAGAADCSTGIVPDLTTLPVLGSGGFATVALLGEAQPPSLELVGLVDDATQSVPDGGSAKLYMRFLHAAPGQPAVDLELDTTGKGPKPLFHAVPYGRASSADASTPDAGLKVDTNGYLATSALSHSTCSSINDVTCPQLSVVQTGQEESDGAAPLATGTIAAAAGAVITVAFVGDSVPSDGGTGAPFAVLECVDNAATVGLFGSCSLLPP